MATFNKMMIQIYYLTIQLNVIINIIILIEEYHLTNNQKKAIYSKNDSMDPRFKVQEPV